MTRALRAIILITALLTELNALLSYDLEKECDDRYGYYLNYVSGGYNADFSELKDYPICCPTFTSGSSNGVIFGREYYFSIYEKLDLHLRIDNYFSWGTLETIENQTFGANGQIVYGKFKYTIDSYFWAVGFEPQLNYNIWRDMYATISFRLGYIINQGMEQKEIVLDAPSVAFPDSSRLRNHYEGEIKELNPLQASLGAGLRYELTLNKDKTLFLTPELSFNYGLTSYLNDKDWMENSLRLGVTIAYFNQTVEEKPIEEKPKPIERRETEQVDTLIVSADIDDEIFRPGAASLRYDTLMKEERIIINEIITHTDTLLRPKPYHIECFLTASIRALEDDVTMDTVHVEEFRSTKLQPLLNYVFFDDRQSALPVRYHKLTGADAEKFTTDSLYDLTVIDSYHHILNIVGYRMRKLPDAKVRIIGCNAGDEEDNDQVLSKARAEAVAAYLIDVWEVDPTRLTITSRNLPDNPSNMEYEDGVVENRRVEIYSESWDNWEIIRPLELQQNRWQVERKAEVVLVPELVAEKELGHWAITINQGTHVIKSFEGDGALPDTLRWQLRDGSQDMPKYSDNMICRFTATDIKGNKASAEDNILNVSRKTVKMKEIVRTADMKIDEYNLILFEFDKTTLNKANQKVFNLINNNLEKGSIIEIQGFTDRSGDTDYNQQLSDTRARQLAKYFRGYETRAKGLGESKIYDNNLPEGRFYSRTVKIIVETPIK